LWRTLEIDLDGSTSRARLRSPVAAVDLGGIAKGFAVDVAAEALRAHGVVDGLVNVGGDLVALGSDVSGDPWRIGVRSPESADALVSVLDVSDEAVATSGDYLRFFEHGGRRYHHLLDPSTGAPRATSTRSLTLRASCCTDADAAATALFGAPESVAHSILDHVEDDVRVLHHLQEVTT
jgi:thiamine biosynthesis lipoprotein